MFRPNVMTISRERKTVEKSPIDGATCLFHKTFCALAPASGRMKYTHGNIKNNESWKHGDGNMWNLARKYTFGNMKNYQ